jgi:hypothetical protein
MSPAFHGGSSVGPVRKRIKIFLWQIYRWPMMFFRESVLVYWCIGVFGLPIDECHIFPNTFVYHLSKNVCFSREQTGMHGF